MVFIVQLKAGVIAACLIFIYTFLFLCKYTFDSVSSPYFTGIEQIVALAAVSVHRCFLVVRPFTAKKMTTSWAVFFVFLTWLYSFILSIPPAFGWNEYVPEGAGTGECPLSYTPTHTQKQIHITCLDGHIRNIAPTNDSLVYPL